MVLERDLWQVVKAEHLFTKRTMMNALRKGDDTFWTRSHGNIYLIGLLHVTYLLDVRLSAHPVHIEASGGLAEFRRFLVEAFFANKPVTIALATMGQLTGRTRPTVLRYLRHCKKTANLMLSSRSPDDAVIPELAEQGYFRKIIDGKWVLVKRMPNTYSTAHDTAPYGKVKRQEHSLLSTATRATRRYLTRPRAMRRAIERVTDTIYCEVPEHPAQSEHKERDCIIWQGWTCALGNVATI